MDTTDWVPADTCTLPTEQQPLRVAEFDAVFATASRGMRRVPPDLLRVELDPAVEAEVRDLVARESACCSFFDFAVTRTGAGLVLDVRVPAERAGILDAIVRRAAR